MCFAEHPRVHRSVDEDTRKTVPLIGWKDVVRKFVFLAGYFVAFWSLQKL
jgi:hypothetical protein